MKITFACPACGASGSGDSSLEGRQVRCKRCENRFVVPGPVRLETDDDGEAYSLDQAGPRSSTNAPKPDAVFVPARGDEPAAVYTPRRPKRPKASTRRSKREESDFDWQKLLIRSSISLTIILGSIAIFVTNGLAVVGLVLISIGMLMVLVGYGAGAYGAFSEDFLYLVLYLAIPLYCAYYLVTRWDDLWRWAICSTVGVGLVMVGTQLIHWSGVAE